MFPFSLFYAVLSMSCCRRRRSFSFHLRFPMTFRAATRSVSTITGEAAAREGLLCIRVVAVTRVNLPLEERRAGRLEESFGLELSVWRDQLCHVRLVLMFSQVHFSVNRFQYSGDLTFAYRHNTDRLLTQAPSRQQNVFLPTQEDQRVNNPCPRVYISLGCPPSRD